MRVAWRGMLARRGTWCDATAMLRPLTATLLLLAAAPASAEERTYMIAGFDRVRVDGPFSVTVVAGGSPRARAEGDGRALDDLTIRVDGRTLVVARGMNGWGGDPAVRRLPPKVTITAPRLSGAVVVGGGALIVGAMEGARVDLAVNGAGTLTVDHVAADRLGATLVGAGALRVAGRVLDARFTSNGAGTIDAAGLDAAALTVNAQGSGDGSFRARNTANVAASGLGAITVEGAATCVVRGTAPIRCGKDIDPAVSR